MNVIIIILTDIRRFQVINTSRLFVMNNCVKNLCKNKIKCILFYPF